MKLLRPRQLLRLAKDAARGWKEDNCLSMGAALAFYSLLSLAPLLVLVVTIAGLVIGQDQARELLLSQLSGLLGEGSAEGLGAVMANASDRGQGLFQTVVSGAVLLLGATTVFAELQDNLNRIWRCRAPKASGIFAQVRKRLLSFGLIVAIGFLLLVSLAVSAAVTYVGTLWYGGASKVLAHLVEFAGSIVVITALFALTFKILPSRRIPWEDVLLGAFITALLFWIGKFLIGLYLGKSEVVANFGAAGAVVMAILWVYYSSQIFFFGAELTRAYSMSHGSRRQESAANSEFVAEGDMVERARRIVKGRDPAVAEKGR